MPGTMIAYFLPTEVQQRIAVPGGEDPERLHVTLLYLPNEVTPEIQDKLKAVVIQVCSQYAPLPGKIGGCGRFNATTGSEDYDVLIRLVDVPRLELLREIIVTKLRRAGLEFGFEHGYTPHVTLAYVPQEYERIEEGIVEEEAIVVDRLTCTFAEGNVSFPLEGTEVLKKQPSVLPDDLVLDPCFGGYGSSGEKDNRFSARGTLSKALVEKRLVFGWASVVSENGKTVVDYQGDIILEEELERAVYRYVLYHGVGGEMHTGTLEGQTQQIGRMVESMVFTKAKQEALNIDLKKIGWWIGFRVDDDEAWTKILDGKYPAFSIGGGGKRTIVEW